MQNRQSGRRRRGGGGNNNPRPMGMAGGGQNQNRLEVRVRGNAHQLLEKCKQLARDAHQSGDRVATEYYLQHADHYFRVLNDSRIRQEEMRARRGVFDPFEEDNAGSEAEEAADGNADAGAENGDERAAAGQRQQRPREERSDRGERGERRPRFESRDRVDGVDRGDRQMRADRGEQDVGAEEGSERPRRRLERRADRPRDERADRLVPDSAELPLSDGEAALVAFGGAPSRDVGSTVRATEEGAAPGPESDEAPKPRRRGRPRKTVEAEPIEG